MRARTEDFKFNIKEMGREIDNKITTDNLIITGEELYYIYPILNTSLLKSVMKGLNFETDVELQIGERIKYEFGLLVGEDYEWLDYGYYYINEKKYNEDTTTYEYVCYDKMINSMIDYAGVKDAFFPMTIREYITRLLTTINIEFKDKETEFVNYDKVMQFDPYIGEDGTNLGYTYRDVLDELSAVIAGNIMLDNEENAFIKYVEDTQDEIDEEYFKDINVKFGQKFGAINTIILTRSGGSDSIYKCIPEDLPEEERIALQIEDNQIMNENNRDEYIPEILDKLNGLEFYINDYVSTGLMYYEACDKYYANVNGTKYTCIMFNDEPKVEQGLTENIYTELPDEAPDEYKNMSKTDRKINQAYIIVRKNEATIEAVVNTQTEIDITVNGINSYVITQDTIFKEEKDYYKIIVTQDLTFQEEKEYYKLVNGEYVRLIQGKDYQIGDTIPENITYEFNSMEEGVDYQVGDNVEDVGYNVYENVIVGGYTNSINELEGNFKDLLNQVAETTQNVNTQITNIENNVRQLQTDTYTKTEIQQIANGTYKDEEGNNVNVTTVVSETGKFDIDGLLIQKEDGDGNVISDTTGRFNEKGVQIKNKDGEEIFFSGYVDDTRFDTSTRSFKSNSIVFTKNLVATGDTIIGTHALYIQYEDDEGNTGIGEFII